VEKLATEIARLTLADPEIREVEVSVEKPGALRFARSVGVAIRRRSEDFKS
jgi:dihydroneopterin aldolase